jgi:hypothetical protein
MRKHVSSTLKKTVLFSISFLTFSIISSCFFSTPPGLQNPPSNPPKSPDVAGETPTNDTTPTWTWTVTEGATGVSYRLDSTSGEWINGPATQTIFTPSEPLSDGTHTLYVRFRNDDGNWSTTASHQILVDTIAPPAPAVTVVLPAGQRRPLWSWSMPSGTEPQPAQFRFQLDGEDAAAWSVVGANVTSFQPESELSVETHTLFVQAADAAGNWSSSGSGTVDILWQCETVDWRSSSVGHSITLDLDAAGNPNICYIDTPSASVLCAFINGTEWQFETVDTGVGTVAAMAVDIYGNRDVAYTSPSGKILKVRMYDVFEQRVNKEAIEGRETWDPIGRMRVTLDASSRLHIAETRSSLLRFTWLDGTYDPPLSGWNNDFFPNRDDGWAPSLVTLSQGFIKAAYIKNAGVFMAYWENKKWKNGGVAVANPTLDASSDTQIARDGSNLACIAYSTTAGEIYYAKESGSSFDIQLAHEASGSGLGSFSLVYDLANSRPVLLYVDGVDLWCAVPAAGSWQRELVDTGVAEQVSAAVDASGRIMAAYYDAVNGHLRFAQRAPTAP